MKISTSIKPRRDGTVSAVCPSGNRYVLQADASGDLVADVADEADLAFLLTNEAFFPSLEEDFEVAENIIAKVSPPADEDGDDGDDVDEDDGDPAALPVEAETPPAPARKRKPRAA